LASIRRIIADDDSARPAPVPARPAVAPAPSLAAADDRSDDDETLSGLGSPQTPGIAANDVFERKDAAPSRPAAIASRAPAPDEMFDAHDTEEPAGSIRPLPPPAPAVTSANPPAPSEAHLLSPRATAAVDLAFNTLARTVLVQSSRTLEDLV